MANKTIIAVNKTAGDITVIDFGSIVIPALGSYNLTSFISISEAQESSEFDTYIQRGDIVINDGNTNLSVAESINYLTPMAVVSFSDPSIDISNNTSSRHNQSHSFAGTDHLPSTKTDIDSKISDASLISTLSGEINSISAKLIPESTDILLIEDVENANSKKKVTLEAAVIGSGGIAGGIRVQNNKISSTTNRIYQAKLTMTVPFISGEKWRIGYSMEFNSGNPNKSVAVRLYDITDAVVLGESLQQTNSTTNYISFSGIHYETAEVKGDHIYELQYRKITATCNVRNSVLEAFRVL